MAASASPPWAIRGKWNSTDQIPDRAVSEGLIDRFGAIDPSDGGNSSRYSLSADFRQSLWGGQLLSTVYGIRYYLKLWSDFTYYLTNPVDGDQFNQYDNRKILGWNGSWSRPDDVLGYHTQNTIGWDFRQDRIDPVGIYNTVDRQRISVQREDVVRETSYAIYAQNATQWTPWFRTLAGIRTDSFHSDVASNIPANSGSSTAGSACPSCR